MWKKNEWQPESNGQRERNIFNRQPEIQMENVPQANWIFFLFWLPSTTRMRKKIEILNSLTMTEAIFFGLGSIYFELYSFNDAQTQKWSEICSFFYCQSRPSIQRRKAFSTENRTEEFWIHFLLYFDFGSVDGQFGGTGSGHWNTFQWQLRNLFHWFKKNQKNLFICYNNFSFCCIIFQC